MSEFKSVFIFGYSGHSYVVIESLIDAGYLIAGYFDYQKAGKNPYNLEYLGFEKNINIKSIVQDSLVFPSIGENTIREKLVVFFDTHNLMQFVAIDPTAHVSKSSILGLSTYIGKNVTVNAQSRLGKGVILNTNCVVEHECTVGDYVHIAPSGVLCGNVSIGKSSFVGANSVVKQNTLVTDHVTIGAGSVVITNINQKGTWVGNPAKIK